MTNARSNVLTFVFELIMKSENLVWRRLRAAVLIGKFLPTDLTARQPTLDIFVESSHIPRDHPK